MSALEYVPPIPENASASELGSRASPEAITDLYGELEAVIIKAAGGERFAGFGVERGEGTLTFTPNSRRPVTVVIEDDLGQDGLDKGTITVTWFTRLLRSEDARLKVRSCTVGKDGRGSCRVADLPAMTEAPITPALLEGIPREPLTEAHVSKLSQKISHFKEVTKKPNPFRHPVGWLRFVI